MNIKHLRLKTGLSQAAFGERIGLKGQSILLYEKGERNIPESVLKLIKYEFAEHLEGEGKEVKVKELNPSGPSWEMFSEISEENLKLRNNQDHLNRLKVEVSRLQNLNENNKRDYDMILNKVKDLEKDKEYLKRDKEMLQLHIETLTGRNSDKSQTS